MRPTAIELRMLSWPRALKMANLWAKLIPKGTVQNILKRHQDTGSVVSKPQNAGRKSAFSDIALQALKSDVLANPDGTLEEFRSRSRVKVSVVAFHNAIKKLGFTRKKIAICNRAMPRRRSQQA